MLTIGLTGGIGSGKSAVAHFFAELGVPIIDTDVIARTLVEPGTPTLTKIIEHFGSEFLNSDHSLNRAQLALKIFKDPAEKNWLEQLLHPLIRQALASLKAKITAPYCIVVIPLLIETLPNPDIDRILVVTAPESLQIKRTLARDQRSPGDIMAIISSQASPEQRLAAADDVIVNDTDLTTLQTAVTRLHQHYLALSSA
jgi:dephospho-CoA kinase